MKAPYLYVFGIGLALMTAVTNAQQYKWKDARGRWVYGDVPPVGVKWMPLNAPSSRPEAPAKPAEGGATTSAAAKDSKPLKPLTAAEKEMAFRRRIKEAQENATKKAKEEEAERDRQRNCDLAREQERTLASGQRIARLDAKGERYYPDDAERARGLAEARKSVSQWCK